MKARIYKPSKTSMQSGRGKAKGWVLEFDRTQALGPETLMGWTQSGDTLNQVRLHFDTQKAAVSYAKEQGLEYIVGAAQEKKVRPKNYGDNFKYIPYEEQA